MKVDGESNCPLISPNQIRISGDEQAIKTALERVIEFPSNDGCSQATYRKEQSRFRQRLLNAKPVAQCVLCLQNLPSDALVAAHIKPRHQCSPQEQVDINNWALMCSLGCDFLFENCYIEVVDGQITAGNRVLTAELAVRISALIGNHVSNWHQAATYYAEKSLSAKRSRR